MRLILVRHGEALASNNGQDAVRQLSRRGQQQAQQTAAFIQAHYRPDLFVVSPYLRAQQTLAELQQLMPEVPTQVYKDICPDDPAVPAFQWLSNLNQETVVVVCHMNVIAYLAALLTEDVPEPFALSEARVFEHPVLMLGLSQETARYVPQL